MITKYILGSPVKTDAAVLDIPVSCGNIPYFRRDGSGQFVRVLADGDIVYGLGQQVRGINKRGWRYISDNLDNPHHQEDTLSLYGAHNFLIISGEELFGIFFDYPGRMAFDIGYTHREEMSIAADSYDMAVYTITGENELDIVKQFRQLTGKSYAAPKWAFGYGQSRWGYQNAEDIREIARKHRENKIPLDMVYLDIDYMERYKDFTVDGSAFPDFPAFVKEMESQGIHLIPIIDAGIKIEEGYKVYEEGVRNHYFCKDENGKDFVAAVWPGRVHFPDMLNADARKWFGGKYKFLLDMGIEGFWNDMNEPAIFYSENRLRDTIKEVNKLAESNMGIAEYFQLTGMIGGLANHPEDYKQFYHNIDGERIRHDKVHNLFGYYMTRAAKEAFDELSPDKRILLFSRSSYIGAHRYGGIWQGDNNSWWSHLLMNIQMTCSLNMVGFLYTGADLGGFNCDVTEDLLLRWLQFAVFTPLMRNHSAIGTRGQEVFRFDNMESCRKMIELRYVLLPYIYSEYMKAIIRDGMMFKPLGFEFRDSISRAVQDQLLLGNELMLAPVYSQNAEGRYVWLPEEMMKITMEGPEKIMTETMPAGHHYIDIKLDELVFFIRRDKAIPICNRGLNTSDIDMNSLQLIGYNNAKYELYDDDGETRQISEDNIRTLC